MEAVILAGGQIPPALAEVADASERALIRVGEKTLLDCVIQSLQSVPTITGIVCVTTPRALETLPANVRGLAAGALLSANLFAGIRATSSENVLIVTGDVPLATGRTWMQFLDGAAVNRLEIAYSVVEKSQMEAQFPGGKRTYATLKEGTFTGGNAFLVPRERLETLEILIEHAFKARKNPFALAQMLGLSLVFRALTKRLSMDEAAQKVSRMVGARAGAVVIPDAAIAFDVDKAVDLELARQIVAERAKRPESQDFGSQFRFEAKKPRHIG